MTTKLTKSLRSRIRLTVATLLVPLVLVIGVAEFALLDGARALRTTTNEAVNEVLPIAHLEADAESAERLGIDALTENHDDDRQAYREVVADVDEDFAELLRSGGLTEEHDFLETAALAWRRATRSLAMSVAARPLSQEREMAALRAFTDSLDESIGGIKRAAAAANEDLASELAAAERRSWLIQIALALIALLSLAIGLLLGTRLIRSLTVPLSLLVEGSRRFGRGELGHRIVAPRNDELGELASTLNGMADELATQYDELEQNQQRLMQAQKMEAVGQLAGGIAHDFNNLLLVVGSYADFLHESFDEDDPRRADATEIRDASDRAGALTRQLLTFSRQDLTRPVALDASETITGLEGMLRQTMTAMCELRLELDTGLPATMIDAGQLEQALLNLVLNAQNAMPDGGIVTIRANAVAEGASRLVDGLDPGAYVAIAVSDTGHGMSEAVRSRACQPFFTTRADDGGSGLGLASVHGIVTRAGGTVTIESSPSEGTTVVLYLPTTSESIERPSAADPSALAETENGTVVLLTDDNQSVRELATRMLSGQGYTVLAAASGTEALELARRSEQIDVLLTDVIMPGMTGGELAETLAQQRPGLPIVFMSGYSSQIVSKQGVLDKGTLYLEKPFTAQQLLEQLESALAV